MCFLFIMPFTSSKYSLIHWLSFPLFNRYPNCVCSWLTLFMSHILQNTRSLFWGLSYPDAAWKMQNWEEFDFNAHTGFFGCYSSPRGASPAVLLSLVPRPLSLHRLLVLITEVSSHLVSTYSPCRRDCSWFPPKQRSFLTLPLTLRRKSSSPTNCV